MFKIRKQQIAAFKEANLRAFTLEMARHVRRVLPERVAQLDDHALVDSLRQRLTQALSYGITTRFDAMRYLECSYVLGWTDQGPDDEGRIILARDGLNAEEKMDLIEQRTAAVVRR